MAVHMVTGKIIFVSKGYPGAFSEESIVRRELLGKKLAGERFLADNIFRDRSCYVTARYGSEVHRKRIRKHRCLIERRISSLKNYAVLDKAWRGKVEDHSQVMEVVCRLTNLVWQK